MAGKKKNVQMRFVCVVTHSFYLGEALQEFFEKHWPHIKILAFYRDYHFKDYIANIGSVKPILIISGGTCKTRDENGESVAIYYREPKLFAREHGIPTISPYFFGRFFWGLFYLKLVRHINRFR